MGNRSIKTACIIPARYGSTRLPGKPLLDIAGKPLIERVYEQAKKAKVPAAVIVATDDERIQKVVEKFGGTAVLTSRDHATGTDRLAEVAQQLDDCEIIVNVQGDEPLIAPELIDQLATRLAAAEEWSMATVSAPLAQEDWQNPNAVKLVTNLQGEAIYFSRSLIPYPRHENKYQPRKHIGIYAYRRDFLLRFADLPPTPLEEAESLEQLRALEHGYRIGVIETTKKLIGIDTLEDLLRARAYFEGGQQNETGNDR